MRWWWLCQLATSCWMITCLGKWPLGNSKGRFSIVGQHCLARGGPITWGFQLSVFHSAAPHHWRPVLGVDKQSAGQLQVSLNYTATKVTGAISVVFQ